MSVGARVRVSVGRTDGAVRSDCEKSAADRVAALLPGHLLLLQSLADVRMKKVQTSANM